MVRAVNTLFFRRTKAFQVLRGGLGFACTMVAWDAAGVSGWLAVVPLLTALALWGGCPSCWIHGFCRCD